MVVTDTRVHTGDSTSRACIQQSTVFIPVLTKILKKKLSVRSRTSRRRPGALAEPLHHDSADAVCGAILILTTAESTP